MGHHFVFFIFAAAVMTVSTLATPTTFLGEPIAEVPEPTSLILLVTGLAGVGLLGRKLR